MTPTAKPRTPGQETHMDKPLYARRDTEDLGEHYLRHVDAMTREKLHGKSAIAAELAWRDAEIAKLREQVEQFMDNPDESFKAACRTNGINAIVAERARQVSEKGYDAAHDDTHSDGSIGKAAAMIVMDVSAPSPCNDPDEVSDDRLAEWPDKLAAHVEKKYGRNHVRRLTIAGALVAAEIDRLMRNAR